MKNFFALKILAILLGSTLVAVCKSGGGDGGPSGGSASAGCGEVAPVMGTSGSGSFSVSPLETSAALDLIKPLGQVAAAGHTFPTDHMYFYKASGYAHAPVYVPGAGKVRGACLTGDGDYKVYVQMTDTFYYYLDHLNPSVTVGTTVAAGQQLGTASNASAVDFGVVNTSITNTGLTNPDRYEYQAIHADSPLKYFSGSLQTTLYGKVTRVNAPDKDGKIDFDQSGKLIGNWFLQGLATGYPSIDLANSSKWLSITPLFTDPTFTAVGIGGTLATGVGSLVTTTRTDLTTTGSSNVDPASVTSANGVVVYPLANSTIMSPSVCLLVQVVSATSIKAQSYAAVGGACPTTTFNGTEQTYTR